MIHNMKIVAYITVIFALFTLACEPSEKKVSKTTVPKTPSFNGPRIAILGTFHYGSTSDFSAMDVDDLNSKKRQQEIRVLLEALKTYQPTKIMVEYPHEKSEKLSHDFTQYLKGEYDLTINEIEQLGFRLAQDLDHKDIYSIDYTLSLPFGALANFAEHHMKEEFELFLNRIKENDKKDSDRLAKSTLKEYYIYKNSEEEDLKNKNQYLVGTAQFVSDSTYIGVEFVSKWWERNFHIMTNIDRHTSSGDRLLVIIGGAHRAVLKDFYKDRNDIQYEEIATYLESP